MINTEPCPSYYLPGVSLSITAGQTSSLPTLPEPCILGRLYFRLIRLRSPTFAYYRVNFPTQVTDGGD
jgi:hypothetical protein